MWMIPNQRKAMMKSSPIIVLYAEILLIIQYLYSMNLTEAELPTKVNVSIFRFSKTSISNHKISDNWNQSSTNWIGENWFNQRFSVYTSSNKVCHAVDVLGDLEAIFQRKARQKKNQYDCRHGSTIANGGWSCQYRSQRKEKVIQVPQKDGWHVEKLLGATVDLVVDFCNIFMCHSHWEQNDCFSSVLHGARSIFPTSLPTIFKNLGQSYVWILDFPHHLRHDYFDFDLHLPIRQVFNVLGKLFERFIDFVSIFLCFYLFYGFLLFNINIWEFWIMRWNGPGVSFLFCSR